MASFLTETSNPALKHLQPHLRHIRQGLSPVHFNSSWTSEHKQFFKPEDLAAINVIAPLLDQEPEIPSEELALLRKQCNELIDTIISSKSLPERLKEALVTHINSIRFALENFEILGTSGLKRSAGAFAGALAIDYDIVEALNADNSTSSKDTGVWSKLKQFFVTIRKTTNKTSETIKSIEHIGDYADGTAKLLGLSS